MLYQFSARSRDTLERLRAFMDDHIAPNEAVYQDQLAPDRWRQPAVMEELKARAREAGLWNLFVADPSHGEGLSNFEYAPLCEAMGRSAIAPEVFNCAAPDVGNMEVLAQYGTAAQKEKWLAPLLAGEIRSVFAMTEPGVASSDATNIECRIARDGDRTLAVDLLVRTRRTPRQIRMSPHQRFLNTRGAFRVKTAWWDRIQDQRVLLIDDVLTTGATAANCAKALLSGGAAAVDVLTLARVVRPERE